MKITETIIYKTIAPRIQASDRKELARMLRLARDGKCRFNPDSESVWGACLWTESPQGGAWWHELARRLEHRP